MQCRVSFDSLWSMNELGMIGRLGLSCLIYTIKRRITRRGVSNPEQIDCDSIGITGKMSSCTLCRRACPRQLSRHNMRTTSTHLLSCPPHSIPQFFEETKAYRHGSTARQGAAVRTRLGPGQGRRQARVPEGGAEGGRGGRGRGRWGGHSSGRCEGDGPCAGLLGGDRETEVRDGEGKELGERKKCK